jgi:hypothetical protein
LDSQATKSHILIDGFPYTPDIWDEFTTDMKPQGWKASSETVVINMRPVAPLSESALRYEGINWVDVKEKTTDDGIFNEVCSQLQEIEGWKWLQGGTDDANEKKDDELAETAESVETWDCGDVGKQEKKKA